jgi:hypothetical protein
MAERWPFDEWKRNLTDALNFTSAAAASLGLPQPGLLIGDPFTVIVDTARNWLIGKQRTFTFAGHELTLVLEDLSVEGSDLAKAVGQYGQLSILARDVEWADYRFEWVEVQARNVHLRPGTKPVLVAAPIRCEAFLSAQAATRWLASVSPRLELAMHEGVPQVGLAGAPWLRLEIEPGAGGQSIRVVPRSTGGCRCGSRPFTCPCPNCPSTSCSPRWSPRRAASSCAVCSPSGSDRCPGPTSNAC